MLKNFYSLFIKDFQLMAAGRFFPVALGSLLFYTLFINLVYVRYVNDELYNIYLYDPEGIQKEVSGLILPVASPDELDAALFADTNGVGIDVSSGRPEIILYTGSEKADNHRADYALSLLCPDGGYAARCIGVNTKEQKQRKEISCELLFIEITAVGFLGIASVLFKEKQMGVIRIHAVLPLEKSLFLISKIMVFLLSDLLFAILMLALNVGVPDTVSILPAVLVQTGILSVIMALTGFGCAMLLSDFRQFSLAYLVIAVFALTPVFLSANTSVKMAWINWHPFYRVYMGLKNAFFGTAAAEPAYYICCVCGIAVLFLTVQFAFRKEAGKDG